MPLNLTKKNNSRKGNLNLLGRPKTHKTENKSTCVYLNPKYIQHVFFPNTNILDLHLTCPAELTGLSLSGLDALLD